MKKFLLLFLSMVFLSAVYSQDVVVVSTTTTSGMASVQSDSRAGSLYLGLNTDLIHQSPIYASVDPTVTYFLTNTWAVGGKLDYSNEDIGNGESLIRTSLVAYAQKYITDNVFVGAMYSSNLKGNNTFGASIGYTAFLGSRFYLEPSWLLKVQDNNYHGSLQVSCGIKLKD